MIENTAKALGIEVPPQILRLQATAWWSWSDSNQPPKCYGTWLGSEQLPWSDSYADRRALCCFGRFSWLSDIESTTKALWNMVRVRPTTLVGHPRTNHQSVMEHGRVRPAHLVGHPCSRSKVPSCP